jgi:hypothetical protein
MGKGNPGASAPKLSNEFLRSVIADEKADPALARACQEVLDLRTSTMMLSGPGNILELEEELGCALDANIAHLDEITRLREELEATKTLLENARVELSDLRGDAA